jgi:hypothetical protein
VTVLRTHSGSSGSLLADTFLFRTPSRSALSSPWKPGTALFPELCACVATCLPTVSGGDYIPFRGGRIDATEAGPPGVPQPQDTLASHKATFARQGFTAEEMIQVFTVVARQSRG